ncbi:putative sulfoxide reductase heme-binding subunit YedZ, partial [Candidatus Erwinia dacicola]
MRRLLGLWCFAWATLHLVSYSQLELGISNLGLLGSELISRRLATHLLRRLQQSGLSPPWCAE